jgi:hypothetical protein
VTLGEFDPPNDKLDAAERGIEWGCALPYDGLSRQ